MPSLQDKVSLIFQRLPECPVSPVTHEAYSIRNLPDRMIEISYDKSMLEGVPFTFQTSPHCPMRLDKVSRRVALHNRLQLQVKYGMKPEYFKKTTIRMDKNRIRSIINAIQFAFSLAYLPSLHLAEIKGSNAVFRYQGGGSFRPTTIPANFMSHFYTASESGRKDMVEMTLSGYHKGCEIKRY